MRKVQVRLHATKGLAPGVYLVDLPDGLAPGGAVDVDATDADWLIRAAEKAGERTAEDKLNLSGAAEKIAPAVASIAMRFL